NLLTVNSAAARALGYKPHDLIGKNLSALIPAPFHGLFGDYLDVIRRDGVDSGLLQLTKRDGSPVIWEYHNILQVESDGRQYVLGHALDVTETKRWERALQESEEKYRDLFENASDLVQIMSPDGRIDYTNRAWKETLGFDDQEVDGLYWLRIVHPDCRSRCWKVFELVRSGQKIDYFETMFLARDGTSITVEGNITCSLKDGKATSLRGIFRDISWRKRMESDLERARDAALESARLKAEFLANMSHEIRTPMNGIMGTTELLLSTGLTAEQQDLAKTVNLCSESLLGIINDILYLSKIEAGKLEFHLVDFQLRDTLADTMKMLAVRAYSKGLEISYYVAPDVPDQLIGDPARLNQVMVNLVGNAIKFTPTGEVVVKVERHPEVLDDICLQFSVSDTGIGITDEEQRRIFEPFVQADGSNTRQYGGTGLGLSISSRLVDLMDGKIWIDSELGHGSTFHFTARFQPSNIQAASSSRPANGIEDMTVLAAVGNRAEGQLIETLLATWRMKPMVVNTFEAAEKALQQVNARVNAEVGGHAGGFAFVLLDADLPGMTDEALSRSMSSITNLILLARPGWTPPFDDTSGRCRVLTRPIKPSDLLSALTSKIGAAASDPIIPLNSDPQSPPLSAPLRILVAEDNEVNRHVATGILTQYGHSVVAVDSGQQALLALEREPFGLVLMDIQMPGMTGFEAVAEIRKREHKTGGRIPVIALTAYAMEGDKERCLTAGMDAYLSKPIRGREMLQCIAEVMSIPPPAEPQPAADGGPFENTSIDYHALLDSVCGKKVLVQAAVNLFLRKCPTLISQMNEAVLGGDPSLLQRSAHSMKGSSNMLSPAAASSVLRLEKMGRNQDMAGARQELDSLRVEIERVEPELFAIASGSEGVS
ncbi:MAG TPA: PAS domain S-box protein, partial [Blastocatellia bacterium]